MHNYSKTAAVVLAMAIVTFSGFARTPQQDPDPSQGPGGDRPPCPMMRQMRTDGPQGQGDRMGMPGGGMGRREFKLGRLLNDPNVRQQIGVTAEQAAKIRQQESEFRKTQIRNRADLEIKRMDLRDLISAEKPDRSAIDRKLQEVGAAQLAVEKSAIDHHLTMRDALTPDQRQKLHAIMKQRRQPMPMPGGDAVHRGMQGGGRGGRGGAPPPNAQGQAPPNQ